MRAHHGETCLPIGPKRRALQICGRKFRVLGTQFKPRASGHNKRKLASSCPMLRNISTRRRCFRLAQVEIEYCASATQADGGEHSDRRHIAATAAFAAADVTREASQSRGAKWLRLALRRAYERHVYARKRTACSASIDLACGRQIYALAMRSSRNLASEWRQDAAGKTHAA